MFVSRSRCVGAALLLFAAVALASSPSLAATPKVPLSIMRLMQDRKYAEAVEAIDKLPADDKAVDRDYALYLKGRALHFQEKWDAAIAAFEQLGQKFPNSPWARRARFAKGVAFARKGDFRNAEAAYKAEAQFLLSDDRKQEIAEIYLEYADAFFQPPKAKDQAPDFSKALDFYQRAMKVGPEPETRLQVELRIAECQQALQQWQPAAELYEKFIADHAGDPLVIEARFRLGETQMANEQPAEARRAWQDLLDLHSKSPSDRLPQAAFRIAETHAAENSGDDESLSLIVAAVRRFLEKFPQHELAAKARLQIVQTFGEFGRYEDAAKEALASLADKDFSATEQAAVVRFLLASAYRSQSKFDEAVATWREFLAKHPTHPSWTEAQQAVVETEFAKALTRYQKEDFPAARTLWGEFLARYPLDERDQRILYYFGQMHFAEEQWDAAIAAWRNLVQKHPQSEEASQAQYMIGVTLEDKLGRLDEALKEYKKLNWGGHAEAALQRITRLTAKSLAIASERIFRSDETPKLKLTSRNIESVTVRVYTIDLETYFRKMHEARGIEALDIALIDPDHTFEFKIPDYKPLARHEQAIEVAVPIESPAGNGEKNGNQGIDGKNEAGAGVLAVTVSSKTLEATALVLQSDLDVIVKSSRDEAFVFAQNMLTGKAWPGVRVLLSDGQQVFGDGETNADGVFHQSFEQLKTAGDLQAFAIAGRHTASNRLGLQGLGVAQGLANKGYLYTDRPAYRPGQMVHLRGVIRKVAGDTYSVAAGRKFFLDVFDDRNRLVHEGRVTLNEYGSFHTHLLLSPAASLGEYRVVLQAELPGGGRAGVSQAVPQEQHPVPAPAEAPADPFGDAPPPAPAPGGGCDETAGDAQSTGNAEAVLTADNEDAADEEKEEESQADEVYQGSFLVHEEKLEPVFVEIETKRTVFYRGEEIEGVIRVRFDYGSPLVGREVRYRLADERIITGKTNAAGEVAFKLPTRQFREAQPLLLVAELPERNLQTAKTLHLATLGFALTAETVRDTYLAGETFDLTVAAKDADGKPVETPLSLRVSRRTEIEGEVGEVPVEEHALKTDAAGDARITLKLDNGGYHIFRVSGQDRFGSTVEATTAVQISDDKDPVRLRILADRYSFRVGDTAGLQVHWRDKPALALVTFEGAKILDYRLVELKTGSNKLDVPMTAKLAPNFELSIAVMTDRREPVAAEKPVAKPDDESKPLRIHVANSPFNVERPLNIAMKIERDVAVAKPAEKPTAKPAAKQPAGKQAAQAADAELRPGDAVKVTITTTDPQGRPQAAEVSLALVEQSLLRRFASPVPPIGDFFRGEPRVPAVRTTTSIDFSDEPATEPIDSQLLAESDRLAVEEEERERLAEVTEILDDDFTDDGRAVLLGDDDAQRPFVTSVVPVDGGGVMLGGLTINQAQQMHGGGGMGGGGFGLGFGVDKSPETAKLRQRLSRSGVANGDPFGEPAASVDFDSDGVWGNMPTNLNLAIDDVTAAIQPQTWDEAGGPGTVANFSGNLRLLASGGDLPAINQQGEWFLFNGRGNDDAANKAFVEKLAAAGGALLPHLPIHETAYWNPAITTDAKGQAVVTFTLPDRSTGWTLTAKGITPDTLAGEAKQEFAVKKDLFGQIKLPAIATDGDTTEALVSVHNQAIERGEIEVTLEVTIGNKVTTVTKKIAVERKGVHEVGFEQLLQLPTEAAADAAANAAEKSVEGPFGEAIFELTVQAGERIDRVRRTVRIRPRGLPMFSVRGGSAAGDVTAFVSQPAGVTLENPRLQVIIGPTVEQSLLDAVLAPATWCQMESARYATTGESAAADLLAALALQKLLAATREAGGPQVESLDARIRASISLLIASQQDDGGWNWSGGISRDGSSIASDKFASARVLWAFSLARAAGYRIADEAFLQATNFVRTKLVESAVTDYETKAVLLHALTVAGSDDFPLANQLYRNRASLSSAGLAYLALAFAEMDRQPTAIELLDRLAEQLAAAEKNAVGADRTAGAAPLPATPTAGLAWTQSDVELRALFALALEKAAPTDARLATQIDWLMANRTGHRWSPDKATGPAMLAVGRWFGRTKFTAEKYKLKIFVNDLLAEELDFTGDSRTQTIDVDPKLLRADQPAQRVRMELDGRGRYTYQCVLGGFVPSEKLKNTTRQWQVTRRYEPAALEVDGKEVPRGFDVLEIPDKTYHNPLTQLPVGRRGLITLQVYRQNTASATPEEQLPYLILTEALPAGTAVVESSIRGNFERYEISPGAITFFQQRRLFHSHISFEVHGYLPGTYHAMPTVVRDAYRPDQMAVAEPRSLTVLAQGAASADAYKLTPRELYELGKIEFEKGNLPAAAEHLGELAEKWNLKPDVYKDTVHLLLQLHLQQGPAASVVRYFEIIIEKFPDLEIPFAKLLQVGDAYHEIGEYERSYLVFRATVEASFLRESQLAGFLESQDEFLRSVEVMSGLLREYPPEPYLATAEYALAQRIYAKAPEAAADAKLRAAKITRVDLIRDAWSRLDQFLAASPQDPAADQAAFSLANTLLDLELYREAIGRCEQFAAVYPDSRYLDSFWYITGFCHFAEGEHAKATAMCRKVADAKHKEPGTGRLIDSPNKWQAIYILGQIHHSLGQAAEAIREYGRVKDRFSDAQQAIDYFARKDIRLPEVSSFKPGEAVEVELDFRNVARCDVTVYRVDLMKFSLLRRDLSDITHINLAGIRPQHQAAVELGDGRDFRDMKKKLPLPLKDEGAYLIVCRGENLHTSGMVLITPLVVEVSEAVESGRVRATVKDAAADRYVHDVHVKVIGTRNGEFTSGQTDLRGIFVADSILGRSTVIAQAGNNRYAFFRGQTELGPPPQPAPNEAAEAAAAPADMPADSKGELLNNLRDANGEIQVEQQQQLKAVYGNDVDQGIGGGFGGGFF